MSATIVPTWIQQAKSILVTGLGEVLNNLSESSPTSSNVYQGVVLSMLDYMTLADILLLQTDLNNITALYSEVDIPSTYPAVTNRLQGIANLLNGPLSFNINNIYANINYQNLYGGFSIWPKTVTQLIPTLFSWYNEVPVTTTSFVECAAETATQWQEFSQLGSLTAPQTNTAAHMAMIAQYVADYAQYVYINPTANPFGSFQALWSQLGALKAYFVHTSYTFMDFMASYRQSYDVMRAIALLFAFSNAGVFASSSTVQNSTINLATLRDGETLQAFAQRTTGNFENWVTIAQINNLVPPYVNYGPTPIPGTVMPGQSLFLPPGPSTIPTSYNQNILGTDLNFGPPYGDMPPFTGDIDFLTGTANYLTALLRRVLTQIRTYPYNSQYGSRLPGEVGNAYSEAETGRLAAYLKATLLQDPRTASVPSITASFAPQTQTFSATASVVPIGNNPPLPFNVSVSSNG